MFIKYYEKTFSLLHKINKHYVRWITEECQASKRFTMMADAFGANTWT